MALHLTWVPDGVLSQIFGYRLYKRIGPGVITDSDFLIQVGTNPVYDDEDYTRETLESPGYAYAVKALTTQGLTDFSNTVLITASFFLPGYEEDWNLVVPDVLVLPGYEEPWNYTLPSIRSLEYFEDWSS